MSREIKYRAWHKEKKKMFNVDYIDFKCQAHSVGLSDPKYDEALRSDDRRDIELMQFTGVKDNKGVDIYEGDILQPERYIKTNWLRGVVEFKNSAFQLTGENYSQNNLYLSMKLGSKANNVIIVIGNIYEHANLLNYESKQR